MAVAHQRAGGGDVTGADGGGEGMDPLVLADHVASAAAHDGIGQPGDVVGGRGPQRADRGLGDRQLGDPLGVRRRGERAPGVREDDDPLDVGRAAAPA